MEWKIVSFQEFSVEELYDVMKLRFDVFVLEQECLYQEFDGRDQGGFHLLLKDGGKLVGTARVLPESERVYMGRIVLLPPYRSKGFGKKMLEFTLEFIRDNFEEKDIELQAQAYLRGFYESLGFEAISGHYLDEGIEHVDMRWRRR